LEIAAINDLTDTATLDDTFETRFVYGTYHRKVSFDDQNIIVDDQKIRVYSETEPGNLPWGELGVDVVIESTGRFY